MIFAVYGRAVGVRCMAKNKKKPWDGGTLCRKAQPGDSIWVSTKLGIAGTMVATVWHHGRKSTSGIMMNTCDIYIHVDEFSWLRLTRDGGIHSSEIIS